MASPSSTHYGKALVFTLGSWRLEVEDGLTKYRLLRILPPLRRKVMVYTFGYQCPQLEDSLTIHCDLIIFCLLNRKVVAFAFGMKSKT